MTLSTHLSLPPVPGWRLPFSVRSPPANQRPVFMSRDLYWPVRGSWVSPGNRALCCSLATTQEDETCAGHCRRRHLFTSYRRQNCWRQQAGTCVKNNAEFNLKHRSLLFIYTLKEQQKDKMSPSLLSSALTFKTHVKMSVLRIIARGKMHNTGP